MTETRSAMPDHEGEGGHMARILESWPCLVLFGEGCNYAGLLIKDLHSTINKSKILNSYADSEG